MLWRYSLRERDVDGIFKTNDSLSFNQQTKSPPIWTPRDCFRVKSERIISFESASSIIHINNNALTGSSIKLYVRKRNSWARQATGK